jgi:FkbM family methyltransferase
MSIVEGIRSHYRLFGPAGIWFAAKARCYGRRMEVAVRCDRVRHPVYLRMRTTDVSLFEEIIMNAEYALQPPVPPRVIVDAGANIGLTSAFFATRFPDARIIAIEPESANFELLKKNVACYPNITALRAALWKEDGPLTLVDPGSGAWGFQTRDHHPEDQSMAVVPGLTLDSLMARCGIDRIDILKVDIEGAEKEVFEHAQKWIERVGILMIELHDRDKAGCSDSVHGALKNFEQAWSHGETTVFRHRTLPPLKERESPDSSRPAYAVQLRPRIVAAL